MTGDNRLPKLIAFDLDYTLWPLWIDSHFSSPLERDGDTWNEVHDRYGSIVAFYDDVPQILHRLRAAGVVIAACSRTTASALARQALSLLLVPPKDGDPNRRSCLLSRSKIAHFKQLHKKTGIPYSEMLFYDDESRNKEVAPLGVTFQLVPHGLDNTTFEKGLANWRKRNPEVSLEETTSSA
ncbi:magnesium-dependent phosphatase-1 [Lactarius quietus]|nr:magnesium-dependent phosphatase-1 [Lactarius quietus]